ncbi:MAG: type II toxin-antitoxin system RelB/DinJ family antitoxin [Defluviitaleaceae bacterium]|nr:type II toxin-antitoxin system RelB/DinJ family antitoxin [Defluviitaleaceae bacterium]
MAEITITIPDATKEMAEIFLEELGFDFSRIFTVFIKQVIREGCIPFDITLRTLNDDDYTLTKEDLLQRAKEMDAAFAFATPVSTV